MGNVTVETCDWWLKNLNTQVIEENRGRLFPVGSATQDVLNQVCWEVEGNILSPMDLLTRSET